MDPSSSEGVGSFADAYNKLLEKIAISFEQINIALITKYYEEVAIEFYSFVTLLDKKIYKRYLDTLLTTISTVYGLAPVKTIFVRFGAYSIDLWGPLYWKFFHYTSILLCHAHQTGKISDFCNFSLLIYNIDEILPCAICTQHYKSIKESSMNQMIIRKIAYGEVISGLQQFHSAITANVQSYNLHGVKKSHFDIDQFARMYNCVELRNVNILSSVDNYLQCAVDWQTEIHTALSILLARHVGETFSAASNKIKQTLYVNKSVFTKVPHVFHPLQKQFYERSPEAVMFDKSTEREIVSRLCAALLCRFDKSKIVQIDDAFRWALIYVYDQHTEFIKVLAESVPNTHDDNDNDNDKSEVKKYTLTKELLPPTKSQLLYILSSKDYSFLREKLN